MSRRIYKNPPVVEAVCSFQFQQDESWNLTIPGRLYERVKEEYPEEPEQQLFFQTDMETDTASASAQLKVGGPSARVALKNGSKIITISPNNLNIHSLAPYEGWGSFYPRILRALQSYRTVVGEVAIAEVSLRYVNRVFLPGKRIRFGDYFTVTQALPEDGFPGLITSFFDRMEVRYEDSSKIAFTWTSEGDSADKIAFIMDFDLHSAGEVSFDNVPATLEDLREKERVAFESLIQDPLREIFDADS